MSFLKIFIKKPSIRPTRISVKFPYMTQQIFIEEHATDSIVSHVLAMKYDKIIAVLDSRVYERKKEFFEALFKKLGVADFLIIESDDKGKIFNGCERILDKAISSELSRKSCILSIGGGHVGDMVGFTASIYMRGIDFIQIPTTLMSMVDAIIGKVAVNFGGKKNLLGSFYSPRMTFCNIDLIRTTDSKDKTNGLVEVWKHSLLAADIPKQKLIVRYLASEENERMPYLRELIVYSLKVKKSFVERDYDDTKGRHKSLSLGHTFSDYLESSMEISHGPAVFYGILLSYLISCKTGGFLPKKSPIFLEAVETFEKEIRMFPYLRQSLDVEDAMRQLRFNKINSAGTYSFVLLKNSGFSVSRNIHPDLLRECLGVLKSKTFSEIVSGKLW